MSKYSDGNTKRFEPRYKKKHSRYNEDEKDYSRVYFYQGARNSINNEEFFFTNYLQRNDEYKAFVINEIKQIKANPNHLLKNYEHKGIYEQNDEVIPGSTSYNRFNQILRVNLSRKKIFDEFYISKIKRYSNREKPMFQICVIDDNSKGLKVLIYDVHHLLLASSNRTTNNVNITSMPLVKEYNKRKNCDIDVADLIDSAVLMEESAEV